MGSNIFLILSRWSSASLKSSRFSVGLMRHSSTSPKGLDTKKEEPAPEYEPEFVQEEPKPEDEIKLKILEASLPFVSAHGWSKAAISAGAETLGYPGVIHGMFPRGAVELIQHFYRTSNDTLAAKLKNDAELMEIDPERKVSEKVVMTHAVETRLRMITPYKGHWPQALAIMTLPPNVPTALANLLTLVDDICYFAGDRSVDMGWYGKRVTLAGVYKATELYMLQDKSEDHLHTWQFLNRRMDEMSQLQSCINQSEQASQFAKEVASAAFTTARNILGINWNR